MPENENLSFESCSRPNKRCQEADQQIQEIGHHALDNPIRLPVPHWMRFSEGTGSAADWANESHAIAQRIIYGELPHEPGYLPSSYERAALPIVNEQLEKAGVRVAAVLNAVLPR